MKISYFFAMMCLHMVYTFYQYKLFFPPTYLQSAGVGSQSSWKPNNTLSSISMPIDKQFQKL